MSNKNISQILKIISIAIIGGFGIYIFAVEFKPIYAIASTIIGFTLYFIAIALENKSDNNTNKRSWNILISIFTILICMLIFVVCNFATKR